MKKQNVIWGLVFIGISIGDGVVRSGIIGKNLGILLAGICWALLGGLPLFQPSTFSPDVSDDQYSVVATWSRLPSIGDQIGNGFYRCELLGAERKPDP